MLTTDRIHHCPYCNEPIDVRQANAGGVVDCPKCHKRSVLNDGDEAEQIADKEKSVAGAEETTVARFQTAMLRRHPLRIVGLLFLFVSGAWAFGLSWSYDSWFLFAGGAAALLAAVGCWLVWYWRARSSELEVTTKGLVYRRGVFDQRVCELDHANITDIAIYHGRLAGWLNTGSLEVVSGDGDRLTIDDIHDPNAVVALVRKYRND